MEAETSAETGTEASAGANADTGAEAGTRAPVTRRYRQRQVLLTGTLEHRLRVTARASGRSMAETARLAIASQGIIALAREYAELGVPVPPAARADQWPGEADAGDWPVSMTVAPLTADRIRAVALSSGRRTAAIYREALLRGVSVLWWEHTDGLTAIMHRAEEAGMPWREYLTTIPVQKGSGPAREM